MSIRFRMQSLAMLAVVGAGLMGPAREAHAVLAISFTIQQGATTLSFYAVDGNGSPPGYVAPAGYTQVNDTDGVIGTLSLGTVSPFTGYTVSGSVQTQAIAAAVGQLNSLNTSALSVTNNTGGTIIATVAISGTGFAGPAFVSNSSGTATWQDAIGSSLSMSWYDDPQNRQGAEGVTDLPGNLVHSFSDTITLLADQTGTASGPVPVNDPGAFSMSLGFVLTTVDPDTIVNGGRFAEVVSRGQTELKPLAAPVPEPSTMALAVIGLGVMGGMSWLRRRKAA